MIDLRCRKRAMVAAVKTLLIVIALAPFAFAADMMPPPQQNALLQKYCVVCHADTHSNGGLSLEHFDAAQPDPGLAAMIASKIKGGAFGAAGLPPPGRATEDALRDALTVESKGAGEWYVSGSHDATTASIVATVPAKPDPDLYRLRIACRLDTRAGEIQLEWAPGVPPVPRTISVTVDAGAPVPYTVDGHEKMANGTGGGSGPGAMILSATHELPEQSLTVRDLFDNETVVFGFGSLSPSARRGLSACFAPHSRNP